MTFSIFRLFTISLTFILIQTTSAHAVEINDKGAAQLKTMLTNHINNYKKSVEATGAKMTTKGDITVEQGKGYYAATLPETTYTTVAGGNLKIGLIAINAIPTDNPDQWKMSMAIPTPILVTGDKDNVTQRIDIGEQKMGGLWSSKLENFSKLDAVYNNIKFTDIATNDYFSIDKIKILSNLKEQEDKLWDGPTNFMISNFEAGSATAKNEFSLAEIQGVINVKDFSYDLQKEAMDKLQNLDENTAKEKAPNLILDLIKSSGDMDAQFKFNNLKINQTASDSVDVTGIDLIQFGFKSQKPDSHKINQSFNFSYNGLGLKEGAKDTALLPTQFQTGIKLENFPFLDVVNFATDAIGNNKDANAKQVAAAKAMNFLPQKLKEAGSTLTLTDTKWGNATYDVAINGSLKAEPKSPLGGAGFLNITTTGLDAVTTELNKTEAGTAMTPQIAMFRLFTEEDGDKNIARIKLDETGKMTVNGKDMSALMGGGAPAQEAPQAQGEAAQ